MNIQKRSRRERRHRTRREKRRLLDLWILQSMLMWIDGTARGVDFDLIHEVGCLQAMLLWCHEKRHVKVESFVVRRYGHHTHETLCELQARAERRRRPGSRPPAKPVDFAEQMRLQRRVRYQGSRKARAAARRLQRTNSWSYARALLVVGGFAAYALGSLVYAGHGRRVGAV